MKTKPISSVLVFALAVSGIMSGCETTGQSTGLGAVIGGVAGYAIGGEKGALIGAAIGGAAGFGIHKAREKRVKTAQQTVQEYGYEPNQGLKVDLRPATKASPNTVAPGAVMNAELEYAVLGAGAGGTVVAEKQVIQKDGEELVTLRDQSVTREDGTWNVVTPIELNDDVEAGQYDLIQTLTVANNNYSTKTPVTVTAATARGGRQVIVGPTEFIVAAR